VCTEGSVVVRCKSDEIHIKRGGAAWVAADDGPISVEATQAARLFRVTVGL
jgi:mannose-6-phosphate isomerase